jgi:3-dehydroquinate synthase
VNLPEGKNLVGTFTQPREVLIDPDALRTLPPREFRSGLAEIIKCAVIADSRLFARLEGRFDIEDVIAAAVRIKVNVVRRDEREAGRRAILNYGHTIGHAIEAASGYRMRHGEAVAVGMHAEARLMGGLDRQEALLRKFGFPLRARVNRAAVMRHLTSDKKVMSGRLRFALPTRIGAARFPVAPPTSAIYDAVRHVT